MKVRTLCKVLSTVRVIEVYIDGEYESYGFVHEIEKDYGMYKVERITISGRNYALEITPSHFLNIKPRKKR